MPFLQLKKKCEVSVTIWILRIRKLRLKEMKEVGKIQVWSSGPLGSWACVLSGLTFCDPMDYSPPGSSGILQTRRLESVAISFSRGSSLPRNWTQVSYICYIAGGSLTHWATWEAPLGSQRMLNVCFTTWGHYNYVLYPSFCQRFWEWGFPTEGWMTDVMENEQRRTWGLKLDLTHWTQTIELFWDFPFNSLMDVLGFPCGASGKEPICQYKSCKRCRFDPWVRKIPWRRGWQPTPVFLPGESHGEWSLAGYSPWGLKESDTIEVT